jgi:hypothetical protein
MHLQQRVCGNGVACLRHAGRLSSTRGVDGTRKPTSLLTCPAVHMAASCAAGAPPQAQDWLGAHRWAGQQLTWGQLTAAVCPCSPVAVKTGGTRHAAARLPSRSRQCLRARLAAVPPAHSGGSHAALHAKARSHRGRSVRARLGRAGRTARRQATHHGTAAEACQVRHVSKRACWGAASVSAAVACCRRTQSRCLAGRLHARLASATALPLAAACAVRAKAALTAWLAARAPLDGLKAQLLDVVREGLLHAGAAHVRRQ